jgi:hypothetical protein
VHDAKAFARRARASGASQAWVGGLRLLRQDPFYKVLADHGWLKVLDPDYRSDIRSAFLEAFPPRKRKREARAEPVASPATVQATQPGLFDRVS